MGSLAGINAEMPSYHYQPFEYNTPPGITADEERHDVVIVGAGPVGMAMAVDLALKGVRSVVLDDNNVVSVGSRAICWAKRTLEIFDRLGIGERMLDKGVTWKVGRLFHGSKEVYNFDLLPEEGHKYPAFINLQQYYIEQFLVERALEFPELIDLRFNNKVVGHKDSGDHVKVDIQTPDGAYQLEGRYFLACDGAGSPTRKRMNLPFEGQTFDEHFLIVDVEMNDSPFGTDRAERWFWFEPDFHQGQSALLHRQPDNLYRIDLQLGPETDPKVEATEERVLPRIRAIVGNKPFKLDWMSVYKFRCARLERFVHDRTIFVGDSAHVVSPFGARGGNGGIQDVDNLGWKLAAVLKGDADPQLLETYQEERSHAADENIMHSSRATNFMTPKSDVEYQFRNQVLNLAHQRPFARKLINSGRLSTPCSLEGMTLQTDGPGLLRSGATLPDAPLANGKWLLSVLPDEFLLIGVGDVTLPEIPGMERIGIDHETDQYPCFKSEGPVLDQRYGKDTVYLVRPDGHVAASFAEVNTQLLRSAYGKAMGYSHAGERSYA